jgi:23S rRNA (guanosine2251-2'-O)-methyltransferase
VPHNGCAVRVSPVEYVALEGLFEEGATTGIVVLDSVTDPHNIGAVVRTAAAFSIGGVVIAGPSAPPLGGALAKAAAGCLDRVRLARTNVAADALVTSRDAGCWVLGADACGQSITSIRPTDRWVLCMGSEERGLRAKTRSQVDELVSIPMASGVESLNLSVAAGILLYHLCSKHPSG